jgi:TolB-like protein
LSFCFAIVVLTFLGSTVRADNVSGSFSETPIGARALGMGGAFTPIADDVYAMVYNPAGLGHLKKIGFTFDYANLYGLGLLKQSYLAMAFPTRWGVHGISYQGLNVEFTPFPQKLTESTLAYTYAREMGPWALGVSVKYLDLTSDFNEGTGSGMGLDVGARLQVTERWSAGASIRNLYARVRYGTGTSEVIPASWRLGAAYRVSERWIVSGEWGGISGDWFSRFRAGTEYHIFRPRQLGPVSTLSGGRTDSIFKRDEAEEYPVSLAFRTGIEKQFTGGRRLLPALGATLGFGAVSIDYAYLVENKGPGSTNRFSLSYEFMPWKLDEDETPTPAAPAAPMARPTPVSAPAPLSVAVLDLSNATGDPELAWLEIGLADIVAKELAAAGMAVLPRTMLTGTSQLSGPEIVTLAGRVQARLVVRGLFVRNAPGRMTLTARLIDGATGRTIDYVEAEAMETEIFALGKAVGQGIAQRGLAVTQAQR